MVKDGQSMLHALLDLINCCIKR